MGNTLPRIQLYMDKDVKSAFEKKAERYERKPSDYILEMVRLAEAAGFVPGMALSEKVQGSPSYVEYLCTCGERNIINHAYHQELRCMVCGQDTLTFVQDITNRWSSDAEDDWVPDEFDENDWDGDDEDLGGTILDDDSTEVDVLSPDHLILQSTGSLIVVLPPRTRPHTQHS